MSREMDEEMRAHLEFEAEYLARGQGLSFDEARRRARIAFGGVERFREEGISARGLPRLETWVREARLAVRGLVRRPAYSLAAIGTLGLGIGGATAVFAVLNGVVLAPLPFAEPDRLVAVKHVAPGLGLLETGLSSALVRHYSSNARTLDGMATFVEGVGSLFDDFGPGERVRVSRASHNLFGVLGVTPELGRLWVEEDTAPFGATPGVFDSSWTVPILVSHELWLNRYGRDPGILGRVIRVNGSPREIIGVLPAAVDFPRADTRIWILDAPGAGFVYFGLSFELNAVARLQDGVDPSVAEAELSALFPRLSESVPAAAMAQMEEIGLASRVESLREEMIAGAEAPIWIVFGSVALLLLVSAANVSNLVLLRSEERGREFAVRVALGSGHLPIVRLFLTESLLLAVVGGGLGILLAQWGIGGLGSSVPIELPRLPEIRMSGEVILFAVSVSLAIAAAIAALSAARQLGPHAPRSLGTSRPGSTHGAVDRRTRNGLVVVQIGLTLVLLVGSGLMAKSFARLGGVEIGIEPDGILTAEMGIQRGRYLDYEQAYETVMARVSSIPGVTAVAAVTSVPLAGGSGYERAPVREIEAEAGQDIVPPEVTFQFFTPGYFEVAGIEVLEGSGVESDASDALPNPAEFPQPVLISRALAARLFSGERAIGRRLNRLTPEGRIADMLDSDTRQIRDIPPYTVAGVVEDVQDASPRERAEEIVYIPIIQPRVDPSWFPVDATLVIRTALPPSALIESVRNAVGTADPDVSVGKVRPMTDVVRFATSRDRLLALLLTIGGGISLLVGTIGVYGVVAHGMRQRTQELGVRVALGADPSRILAMVLRGTAQLLFAGLVLGTVSAAALTGLLRSVLFGVEPTDPVMFLGAAAVVTTAALVGGFLPALRAARIDAMSALRTD